MWNETMCKKYARTDWLVSLFEVSCSCLISVSRKLLFSLAPDPTAMTKVSWNCCFTSIFAFYAADLNSSEVNATHDATCESVVLVMANLMQLPSPKKELNFVCRSFKLKRIVNTLESHPRSWVMNGRRRREKKKRANRKINKRLKTVRVSHMHADLYFGFGNYFWLRFSLAECAPRMLRSRKKKCW